MNREEIFSRLNGASLSDICIDGELVDGLRFVVKQYGNGRPVILLVCPYGLWAVLTVNISEAHLEEDEICVKVWSENAPVAEALRNSRFFADTGRRVLTGHVYAEVWRVLPER